VRLVGTELWRGSRSLTASLVEGETIAVLGPEVPAPQGTPSWLAAPGSGTLLSAATLTATNIADSEGATLAALSIDDYDDGHLGQASARGFADTHGNRIAVAEAHAIDLDGLDAVFDTGRYHPGEPGWPAPRPLIGQAAITGIQSQTKGMSASVESISLDGFAAQPFKQAPHAAYVQSQAFLLDAATAVSVGAASITGLRYRDEQTKLLATLNALSLSGYADGALAQISLDGLVASDGAPSQAAVGHFALRGLNATTLLHEPAGHSVEGFIAGARRSGVHLAGLALGKVSVTLATGQAITLDSVDETETGSAPMRFTARLRGLSIPARIDPELAQGLGAIGIDPLVLDLDETGSYDSANRMLTADPVVLTARGLGRLSLSAQWSNLPQDITQPDAALAALSGIGIGPFTFRFTNDSLVERIIAMQARQVGKTPEEITDEAKLAGSFAAAALVPGQSDAGEQVAAFIANPQTLTITAAPAAPVTFGAFLGAGGESALHALNLRLSAN
jgi:hypothetical protein